MGFEKKIENRFAWEKKTHKTYHLSDLEKLWFALNAKYVHLCTARREPWNADERNIKVIEWSKGAINRDNIGAIRESYEAYANSDMVADNFIFDWEKFVMEMM